jgi:hypothetical protein
MHLLRSQPVRPMHGHNLTILAWAIAIGMMLWSAVLAVGSM